MVKVDTLFFRVTRNTSIADTSGSKWCICCTYFSIPYHWIPCTSISFVAALLAISIKEHFLSCHVFRRITSPTSTLGCNVWSFVREKIITVFCWLFISFFDENIQCYFHEWSYRLTIADITQIPAFILNLSRTTGTT